MIFLKSNMITFLYITGTKRKILIRAQKGSLMCLLGMLFEGIRIKKGIGQKGYDMFTTQMGMAHTGADGGTGE